MGAIQVESATLLELQSTLDSGSHRILEALAQVRTFSCRMLEHVNEICVERDREVEYWMQEYSDADEEEDDLDYILDQLDSAKERRANARGVLDKVQLQREYIDQRASELATFLQSDCVSASNTLLSMASEVEEYSRYSVPDDVGPQMGSGSFGSATANGSQNAAFSLGQELANLDGLNPTSWAALSEKGDERLELLRNASKVISRSLGIEDVPIELINEDSDLMGAYDPKGNRIFINSGGNLDSGPYWDDLNETVDTLAHELRHAFQSRGDPDMVVDDIKARWESEIREPIDATVDFRGFWEQVTEKDSRSYANDVARGFATGGSN